MNHGGKTVQSAKVERPIISKAEKSPAPAATIGAIAGRIVLLRGQRVMLDADLAALYGVETRRLNEQVRRNADRFPADFMFQLSRHEDRLIRALKRRRISGGFG